MTSWGERINEIINRLEAAALAEAEPVLVQQPTPVPAQVKPAAMNAPGQTKMQPARQQTAQEKPGPKSLPKMQAQDMVQGVIFAEILGPPLARRARRGRYGL